MTHFSLSIKMFSSCFDLERSDFISLLTQRFEFKAFHFRRDLLFSLTVSCNHGNVSNYIFESKVIANQCSKLEILAKNKFALFMYRNKKIRIQ